MSPERCWGPALRPWLWSSDLFQATLLDSSWLVAACYWPTPAIFLSDVKGGIRRNTCATTTFSPLSYPPKKPLLPPLPLHFKVFGFDLHSRLIISNLRRRKLMRRIGAAFDVRGVHVLALERAAHRCIHHQLGQAHGGRVEGFDGAANLFVFLAGLRPFQLFFVLRNYRDFLRAQHLPCGVAAAFFEGQYHVFSLVAGLDDLALAKVLFGVVERIENHLLNLIVREPVGGLHFDFGFLAAALLFGADMQNSVGVDQELYLDARQARRHGRNALQIEAGQRTAIA